MKQLLILNTALLLFFSVNAQQKDKIEIKKGAVLNYTIYPPGAAVNYSFLLILFPHSTLHLPG
jgi:hypothetical protein